MKSLWNRGQLFKQPFDAFAAFLVRFIGVERRQMQRSGGASRNLLGNLQRSTWLGDRLFNLMRNLLNSRSFCSSRRDSGRLIGSRSIEASSGGVLNLVLHGMPSAVRLTATQAEGHTAPNQTTPPSPHELSLLAQASAHDFVTSSSSDPPSCQLHHVGGTTLSQPSFRSLPTSRLSPASSAGRARHELPDSVQ